MREFIIDKLLPAIQACWPLEDAGQTIYIQQDNARPHILPDDEEFEKAVLKTGLDIKLMQQPANSPDLNVLDLGFFSSIQSLTDSRSPTTLQDLIHDVEEEFAGYAVNKLNRIFLTLQACMTEVINHVGGNGYSIPHVNKEKLEKLHKLPTSISCPLEVYQNGLQVLAAAMQEAEAKKEEEAQAAAQEAEAKQCKKRKSSKHKPSKKKQKPSNASTSSNGSTSNAQAMPGQEAEAKQEEEAQAEAQEAEAKQCKKLKSSKHKPSKKKQKHKQCQHKQCTSNASTSNAQEMPAQEVVM
jgi:hypothetical protein